MVELTSVPAFTLNEKEKKLFDTLTTILKENNLKTVLRVCGGWVRDKVSDKKRYDSLVFRYWA